ncbi:MAG TPA: hypothetical protein VFE98_04430 [Candidatus Bathyarchaeia archaeon]|nr:hypothetical protein [Candidatus Bathyarchaeia archaeon]
MRLSPISIFGLCAGTFLLVFSIFPTVSLSPRGSPTVIDAQVAVPPPIDPNRIFMINQTQFLFSARTILFQFTFARMNSSSNILVLLPFNFDNVSRNFSAPYLTDEGFHFVFHPVIYLGSSYWVENATFVNDSGVSNKILGGTLGMAFRLTGDGWDFGPWQDSLLVSLGSNTSPLYYKGCPPKLECLSIFPKTPVAVEIGFASNQIIGDGTFPPPTLIATNVYGRAVFWNFTSVNHFHDIQLFVIANNPAWTFPLPTSYQRIVQSAGFVLLQVFITRSYSDWKKKGPLQTSSSEASGGSRASTPSAVQKEPDQTSEKTSQTEEQCSSDDRVLKIIRIVDRSFATTKTVPFVQLVQYGLIIIGATGIGFVLAGAFFMLIASIAASVGSAQWSNLLALAIATSALGVSAVAIIITADVDKRMISLKEDFHFKRLRVCGCDPVTLHALIKMRAKLPQDVSLEDAYNIDKNQFDKKELVRKLLAN